MALTFPSSPTPGDSYLSYIFDGVKWGVQAGVGGVAGVSSLNTRTGSLTLELADVTGATGSGTTAQSNLGLAKVASTGAYADLSGVPDTRAGTMTNDAAAPGQVGEFVSGQVLQGSAMALASSADKVLKAISLTAGDWDVWAAAGFTTAGQEVTARGWINAAGTTAPSLDQLGGNAYRNIPASAVATTALFSVPATRVSLAAITNVTFGVKATFSGSVSVWGQVMARRRR